MSKTWEFGLRKFNKSQNGTILKKEFGSTLCDKLSTHGFGRGGKRQLWVVTQGKLFNEPHLVPPVLETGADDLMK